MIINITIQELLLTDVGFDSTTSELLAEHDQLNFLLRMMFYSKKIIIVIKVFLNFFYQNRGSLYEGFVNNKYFKLSGKTRRGHFF